MSGAPAEPAKMAEPTDGKGPWKEFLCRACGFIYNERDGDPDSGLSPGTRFDDIPEDWYCPVCGVRKQDFEPYERAALPEAGEHTIPARNKEGGVVIVGGGLAGWAAASEIRARDPGVAITMVTSCRGDIYHKPELAVSFSRGLSPQNLRRESGTGAARRLGLRLLADTAAVGISPRFRKLRTTRGTLRYDHLVVAAGARARVPQNIDPALCWRINDLDAWAGLHAALLGSSKDIAILGAGMIGCELAEDLSRAGHRVTLLALTPTPMEGLLPSVAGARVRAGLEGLGVNYLVTAGVESTGKSRHGRVSIQLEGSRVLAVNELVVATGVAPRERLFRAAGLAFDGGLVVDPGTLRTSDDAIFALGDCIVLDGTPCRFVEPIARQAAAIASAITGAQPAGYEHRTPVIRLKTRSAPVVIEGAIKTGGEWRIVSETESELVMEQRQGGELIARLTA